MKYYLYFALMINLISFIVSITDKFRAVKHKWRISENTLIFLALIGGGVGLLTGLLLSNHKTRKKKFMVGVPAIIIARIAFAAWILKMR